MPACDARYDVVYNPRCGSAPSWGRAPGEVCRHRAWVDMEEDRLPDEWGDPGRLVSARLVGWRSPAARSITYERWGPRMALWIDGSPRRTRAVREYLRWRLPETDPPPDYDPDWVLPP